MIVAPVRKQSPAVEAMAANWSMLDDLMEGTTAMRKRGQVHLPKWPGESDGMYRTRLGTAVLLPAYSRTVEVLTGKPLAKAITLKDVPAGVDALLQNIDSEGRSLHAFAVDLMMDCLGRGISGVLVDHPSTEGVRNRAQEKATGARPYFVRYPPGTVLGWKTKRTKAGKELVQLRLLENETVDDGIFGEKIVEQVRVLTPGAWSIWRAKAERPEEWEEVEKGVTSLAVVPFVFFYGTREAYGVGKPPMLDLAWQNIEHWQSSSDQQTILHVARVPILFAKGFDAKAKLSIGAATAVKSENEKAELKYVEHTGAAIAAGRQSILDLEDRMRQTGAQMLVRRSGKVTATQFTGEESVDKSVLERITEMFDTSLEQCLRLMALYLGEKFDGAVELFKDFGSVDLGEASAEFLLDMNKAGKLSDETLFKEVQRRDLISPDLLWDDEKKNLPPPVDTPASKITPPAPADDE
jgi:hypothetical protein